MKKLMLLIIMILVSCSSISQTVTNRFTAKFKEADSVFVVLTENQARFVIKDLITGDAAKKENKVLKVMVNNLRAQVNLYEKNNGDLEKKATNLQEVSQAKEVLVETYKLKADNNEKLFKKEQTKSTFYKITTAVAVIVTSALLITN